MRIEACVFSTLLYAPRKREQLMEDVKKRLDVFHLRCLCKILDIKWQDEVTNTEVLIQAQLPSMMSIMCIRRRLGYIKCKEDSHIRQNSCILGKFQNRQEAKAGQSPTVR